MGIQEEQLLLVPHAGSLAFGAAAIALERPKAAHMALVAVPQLRPGRQAVGQIRVQSAGDALPKFLPMDVVMEFGMTGIIQSRLATDQGNETPLRLELLKDVGFPGRRSWPRDSDEGFGEHVHTSILGYDFIGCRGRGNGS